MRRVEMKPRDFHKTKRTITGVNGQPEEVLAKYTSGNKCVNECVSELNRQHIYSKTFLAIRAVQIKTRLEFHPTQVKKTNNKKFW